MTPQRDLKRARIVLLAAAERSTRSIAKEVGLQPRIVSHKRILKLLDRPPPEGFARWTGPLLAQALSDVDVQYVWQFLRSHKSDLVPRKSWCGSNDPNSNAADVDASILLRPRRPLYYA